MILNKPIRFEEIIISIMKKVKTGIGLIFLKYTQLSHIPYYHLFFVKELNNSTPPSPQVKSVE